MDIVRQIQASYDGLSRTQKRIADYLIANADEACFLSLKAFAQRVDATEVTVINFTHRIGLDGFTELKKELRGHVRSLLSPSDKLRRAFQLSKGMTVQPNDCIENEMQILRDTFRGIGQEDLFRAVSMLEAATKIYVVGYDSSVPVAQFMLIRLRYLGLDAEPLSFGDYSHMMLELSRCDPKALFVLISFPIHFPMMKALATVARQKGLPLLAIVSEGTSEAAEVADLALRCDTSDVVFYNSITSAISLVNLLCTLFASRHQAKLLDVRNAVQATAQAMDQALGRPQGLEPGREVCESVSLPV